MEYFYRDTYEDVDDDFQCTDDDYSTYDGDDSVSDDDGLTDEEEKRYIRECQMLEELKRKLVDVLGYFGFEKYKTSYA